MSHLPVPPSRRALLAGAATLSLVPPAAAAAPVQDRSDAALLALGGRWATAHAAYLEASAASDALCETVTLPQPPEAVFYRPADREFLFDECTDRHKDGRRWYFVGAPGACATLATRLRRPILRAGGKVWTEAQARADEIVSAYDGWQAALEAAKEAAGLTTADRAVGRLGRALLDIEREIEATSATTLAGLHVKARIAQCDLDEDGDPPSLLMRGIVADLLAMGDAA